MIGYAQAERWSRTPEGFGTKAVEGIAGAETANNAATGAATVPTQFPGIPGSGTTAVILVRLLVHGLRPGPHLFTGQLDKVYDISGTMFVVNALFFVPGLFAAKLFARVTLVPRNILWPVVFAFSILGSCALAQSMLNVQVALVFGIIGYLFRRFAFAVAPVAIGLILGEMVETYLQNSLKMFEGAWCEIGMQPLAALFPVLAVPGIMQLYIVGWFRRRKAVRS